MELKMLNDDEGNIILKYDKGGAKIVMNKNYDIDKMHDHLNYNGCYKKLSRNFTNYIAKEVFEAIKDS